MSGAGSGSVGKSGRDDTGGVEFINALHKQREERDQLQSRGSMSLADQLAAMRSQRASVEANISRENDHRTNVFAQSGKRRCHDFFCVLVFGFTWLLMFAVAIYAYQAGNYYRLVYATDFKGDVCGDPGSGNKDKPMIWYQESKMEQEGADFHNAFGFCIEKCPKRGASIDECIQNFGVDECRVGLSTADHFYRCLPKDLNYLKSGGYAMLDSQLSGAMAACARYASDIKAGLGPTVAVGAFGALVLCICWVYLLGYFPGVMVWGTLVLMLSLLAGLTFIAGECAGYFGECMVEGKTFYEIDASSHGYELAFWILLTLCVVFALLTFFLCTRIQVYKLECYCAAILLYTVLCHMLVFVLYCTALSYTHISTVQLYTHTPLYNCIRILHCTHTPLYSYSTALSACSRHPGPCCRLRPRHALSLRLPIGAGAAAPVSLLLLDRCRQPSLQVA
jgi:hypothetical protein